jgi:hypothetical protein
MDQYRSLLSMPDVLPTDLRRDLPSSDSTATMVYGEHFFEHLEYPTDTSQFLSEALRILRPNGLLSLGVPDAELALKAYVAKETSPLSACPSAAPSCSHRSQPRHRWPITPLLLTPCTPSATVQAKQPRSSKIARRPWSLFASERMSRSLNLRLTLTNVDHNYKLFWQLPAQPVVPKRGYACVRLLRRC